MCVHFWIIEITNPTDLNIGWMYWVEQCTQVQRADGPLDLWFDRYDKSRCEIVQTFLRDSSERDGGKSEGDNKRYKEFGNNHFKVSGDDDDDDDDKIYNVIDDGKERGR